MCSALLRACCQAAQERARPPQGTGRAADLIAECLDIYEEGLRRSGADGADDDDDVAVTLRDQATAPPLAIGTSRASNYAEAQGLRRSAGACTASLTRADGRRRQVRADPRIRMRRAILVRRSLLMLGELRDFALEGSQQGSDGSGPRRQRSSPWPPSVGDVTDAEMADGRVPWMWKRVPCGPGERTGMKWVRLAVGGEEGGPAAEEVVLQPGSREHLLWTVRAGYQMFKEYNVGVAKAGAVLTTMCQLYDAVVSGRCLAYRLGARRRVEGRLVPLPVDDHILMCIVECGMARDAELEKARHFWGLWKKSLGHGGSGAAGLEETTAAVAAAASVGAHADVGAQWVEACTRYCRDVDRKHQSRRLRLLIEWDRPHLVTAMLRELGGGSVELLGECLHHAIVHDRCEIAVAALDLGANTVAYNRLELRNWVEMLAVGSDEREERYMLSLVREGARKIGSPISHVEEIRDDRDAMRILNRIYSLLVTDQVRWHALVSAPREISESQF